MSRRRRKNKNGLAGKERNVYKQRREVAAQTQRSVEEFHFDFDEKPDVSLGVPIRFRNDFLPSAEPDVATTTRPQTSSDDNQLTFPVSETVPAVMRIVKDDDQRPAQTTTSRRQVIQRNLSSLKAKSADRPSTFTWRGYLQGCAWGGAVAAMILVALRIAS